MDSKQIPQSAFRNPQSVIHYSVFPIKFGWCGLVKGEKGLLEFILPGMEREEILSYIKGKYDNLRVDTGYLVMLEIQVKKYFSGLKVNFEFPLDLSPCTDFQKRVYEAVISIPYGAVRTYGWIGERIGNSYAQRAIGGALAKNPIPLIIPCHRVIRKDGKLGEFSAPGGVELKIKMLEMERPGEQDSPFSQRVKMKQ